MKPLPRGCTGESVPEQQNLLSYDGCSPLNRYSRIGKTKTEDGLPDRFECYGVNNDDILGNVERGPHPKPIEENRDEIKSYITDAYRYGMMIMDQLDGHLHLPKGTFASKQRLERPSRSQLRMLRYPPQPEGDRRTAFLGHTDLGTLTILFNVLGGLQILPPGLEATDENWRYVRPEPGCAVLNIGDAMVEWSGGVLRSNLHRVYFAPGAQAEFERYSLALAIRPECDASMKRLVIPGSFIPPLEEGEEDLDCDANEWGTKKAIALMSGRDAARSRGGRELFVPHRFHGLPPAMAAHVSGLNGFLVRVTSKVRYFASTLFRGH